MRVYGKRFDTDALLPLLDLVVKAEILVAEVLYVERETAQIARHVELGKIGMIRTQNTVLLRNLKEDGNFPENGP